jgi:hypothetical protein
MFKDYCENYSDDQIPQLRFYEEIRTYEKTECPDERKKLAKSIYDNFIMKEMLSHTHVCISMDFDLYTLRVMHNQNTFSYNHNYIN